MKTSEIIEEIVKGDHVEEVFRILLDIIIEQKNNYKEGCHEYKSCLRAIHKLNKGRNEGIDSLSEV